VYLVLSSQRIFLQLAAIDLTCRRSRKNLMHS
jgi:hypothetical protein